MPQKIVLASSSQFRRQLMARLRLDFSVIEPNVDERFDANESAIAYVRRLAESKARAVAEREPDAVVIGSDQCALIDDRILGKPGNHKNALEQLRLAQGRSVRFHTAVCVMQLGKQFCAVEEVPYEVKFRQLSDSQLEHYLRLEQPYDCAGSFKAEGYGICLFERMYGDDPNALIGLPLIKLVAMLERAGVTVV